MIHTYFNKKWYLRLEFDASFEILVMLVITWSFKVLKV